MRIIRRWTRREMATWKGTHILDELADHIAAPALKAAAWILDFVKTEQLCCVMTELCYILAALLPAAERSPIGHDSHSQYAHAAETCMWESGGLAFALTVQQATAAGDTAHVP